MRPYYGHPPACTCVACTRAGPRRLTSNAAPPGSSRRLSQFRGSEGGGDAHKSSWGCGTWIAIGVAALFAVGLVWSLMENQDDSASEASMATPRATYTPDPPPSPTAKPTSTALAVTDPPTPTPAPMAIIVPTNTPLPTLTPTPTAAPARTPTPRPTPQPIIVPTNTSVPTRLATPSPSNTAVRFFRSVGDLSAASQSDRPEVDLAELEVLIHDLVNSERTSRGLGPLQSEEAIASIARSHSQDMATSGYFEHVNPEGQDPTARGSSAGYDCIKHYGTYYTFGLAENISQSWLYSSLTRINGTVLYDWNTQEEIASGVVEGWMGSQGHRENILDGSYDRTGIGVAVSEDGQVLVTQNFC